MAPTRSSRLSKCLAERAWKSNAQGDITGWRKRPHDEAQNRLVVIGGAVQNTSLTTVVPVKDVRRFRVLPRRPSKATLSIKMESLGCQDWGDAPLLPDGQTAAASSRHEVATYLPRSSYQCVPFQKVEQLLITRVGPSPEGAATLQLEAGTWTLTYGWGSIYTPSSSEQRHTVNLMMQDPQGHVEMLFNQGYTSDAALRRARYESLKQGVTFSVQAPGTYYFWCFAPFTSAAARMSFNLVCQGNHLLPIERPALPCNLNDFVNWDDADAPKGRHSGAPRAWPDADAVGVADGRPQWHDADFVDTIPSGDYPLSTNYLSMGREGWELGLIAHAIRSDLGLLTRMNGSISPMSGEIAQSGPLTILLPPQVPVFPLNFYKGASGWGLGDAYVTERLHTNVLDTRICIDNKCKGLITRSSTKVLGPVWNLTGTTPFNRIVVGAPSTAFTVWWQRRSDSLWQRLPPFAPVPLPFLPRSAQLWSSDLPLPPQAPKRLAVSFEAANASNPQPLYGVWTCDEVTRWKIWLDKDGTPWSGATGSTNPVDVTALPAGSPISVSTQHSLIVNGLAAGLYVIHLRAEVPGAGAAQTWGNSTLAEQPGAETTQGIETRIQVRVS